MTRINTNVSSLNAQKSLGMANAQLQQTLTRLSTGMRINSGKDDPAGLIASEVLRSDIVSTQKAISNSQRANQVIGTADSALGQVNNLLNDIRGLVTEAANTGAMSPDQIAANQLQVDSALEALNRIATTTSFQGRRLLDGSLDFISDLANVDTVRDYEIAQANLGATGQVAVNVDIINAATLAEITDTGFSAGTQAQATATLAPGAPIASAAVAKIDVMATSLESKWSGVQIWLVTDSTVADTEAEVEYDSITNRLNIRINNAGTATGDVVAAAINSDTTEFRAVVTAGGGNKFVVADAGKLGTTAAQTLTVKAHATQFGANFNHMQVEFASSASVAVGTPQVAYDEVNNRMTITVHDDAVTDLTTIANAITAYGTGTTFIGSAGAVAGARSNMIGALGADVRATGNTGTTGGNTLNDSLVLQLTGADGTEVFNFESGTSINQVARAVNLVADSLGVQADFAVNTTTFAATLTLESTKYGSEGFVQVEIINEGAAGNFKTNLSAFREEGDDIEGSINGVTATGRGNTMSINTSTLDTTITVDDGSDIDFQFTITGGGSLFQLGPEVRRTQQARIGVPSVNTAKLGGTHGRLYELGTGQDAALDTDPTTAGEILDEAIIKVASLRGRLGAFQRTSLDTNIKTLSDTVVNLTDAESMIRDADFAAESSALTRAQILVQAGTSVLAIANQGPQNVLALLR